MIKFTFKDKENKEIQCYKWDNVQGEVKGVLQISHGMTETALRYSYFAEKLNENGYIVYANDHRGHGDTAKSKEELGYIADEDGFKWMVEDLSQLTDIIIEENPRKEVILFGHSMGSFLAQRYIEIYGDKIDKLILSGTNGRPDNITKIGEIIAKIEMKLKGRKHTSKLMDKLSFGDFNRNFKPNRTEFDWLCGNEEAVDEYIANEKCGFICSSSFYYDLIKGLWTIHRKSELKRINKKLPIYIFAGDKDPVGNSGEGILNLYKLYKDLGIEDVSYKLYENGRHEMLNEKNRDEVIDDVLKFLTK